MPERQDMKNMKSVKNMKKSFSSCSSCPSSDFMTFFWAAVRRTQKRITNA